MASDALWIVNFKCVVKGYEEYLFDVNDDEVFKKGCAFRIGNERGQLGHLEHNF